MRIRRVQMKVRPQRTGLERLLMRWPAGCRAMTALVMRLRDGHPLRLVLLGAAVDRSYAALERGDYELVQELLYRPDVVLRFADDPGPDFRREYRGREASFDAYARWLAAWGQMSRRPSGFLDRGDTLIVLGHQRVSGAGSGLEVESELGQVFRLDRGLVTEQTEFRSWDAALLAAGAR